MPGSLPWQFLSHCLQQVQATPVCNQYSKVQKPKETESHLIPVPGRIGRFACSSHSLKNVVHLPLLHSSEPPSRLSWPPPQLWEGPGLLGLPPDLEHRAGVAPRGPCGPQSTLLPAEAPHSEFPPKRNSSFFTADPSSQRCPWHDEAPMYGDIDLVTCVEKRISEGGTSVASVKDQINYVKNIINEKEQRL